MSYAVCCDGIMRWEVQETPDHKGWMAVLETKAPASEFTYTNHVELHHQYFKDRGEAEHWVDREGERVAKTYTHFSTH